MRHPIMVGLVAAVLILPTSLSLADERDPLETAREELEKQLKELVDHVLQLQNEMATLEQRVVDLESEGRSAKRRGVEAESSPTIPPKPKDLTGKVAIPISTRTIPAFASVSREDFLDRRDMTIARVYLPAERVPANCITDPREILGRVLRHEKPAGYIFLSDEFYPLGTRPGPMAGVPPGKRGVWVEASEVPGFEELGQHDRFDLLMTNEVTEGGSSGAGPMADEPSKARPADSAGTATLPKAGERRRVEVRTIVSNGEVVQAADRRRTRAFIAVDPREAAALNLARSLGARLEVAVRSGQPSEDASQGEVPDLGWVRVYKPRSIPAIPKEGRGDK